MSKMYLKQEPIRKREYVLGNLVLPILFFGLLGLIVGKFSWSLLLISLVISYIIMFLTRIRICQSKIERADE